MTVSSPLADNPRITPDGNRRGAMRTGVNVLITMLLGGLWHGASWSFVIWGLYNGLGLAGRKFWVEHVRPSHSRTPDITLLGWTASFILVCGGWIVFRSKVAGLTSGGIERFFLPFLILLPIVAAAHLLGVAGARARAATREEVLDVIRIRRPTKSMIPMRLVMPRGTIVGAFVVTAWLIMLFLFSPLSRWSS